MLEAGRLAQYSAFATCFSLVIGAADMAVQFFGVVAFVSFGPDFAQLYAQVQVLHHCFKGSQVPGPSHYQHLL